MRPKEILGLVAMMIVGLIVFLVTKEKNLGLRLTKVENALDDIQNNSSQILHSSDQTRLALACMIEDQMQIKTVEAEDIVPVGFKYKWSKP